MVLEETSSQGGERRDMVFTGREHAERTRTTAGELSRRGGCLLGTEGGQWLCLRRCRYLFATRATEARPCWERSRIVCAGVALRSAESLRFGCAQADRDKT